MSKKVNNIEFKGNSRFFGTGKKEDQNNKTKQTLFKPTEKPAFGQLGTGILRPPKRYFDIDIRKPWKPNEKFDASGHLSEEEKMKRLSTQVADSVQQRIDEALKKKKTETATTSTVSPEKEETKAKAPIGVKLLYLGAGLLLAGMVYAVYTQLDKAKPKAA